MNEVGGTGDWEEEPKEGPNMLSNALPASAGAVIGGENEAFLKNGFELVEGAGLTTFGGLLIDGGGALRACSTSLFEASTCLAVSSASLAASSTSLAAAAISARIRSRSASFVDSCFLLIATNPLCCRASDFNFSS